MFRLFFGCCVHAVLNLQHELYLPLGVLAQLTTDKYLIQPHLRLIKIAVTMLVIEKNTVANEVMLLKV